MIVDYVKRKHFALTCADDNIPCITTNTKTLLSAMRTEFEFNSSMKVKEFIDDNTPSVSEMKPFFVGWVKPGQK